MAYFGKTSTSLPKLEPRVVLLVAWIAMCTFVLSVIARGGFFSGGQASTSVAPRALTAQVLVPRELIPTGRKLTPDLFQFEDRDISNSKEAVVRSLAEIQGGYSIKPMRPKEPVTKDLVTFESPSNAVTARIPDGFRAVTISVDAESGVEGWVRPGVDVDVVWITTLRGRQVVSIIVENAKVLSAERMTESDPADAANKNIPSHVTLMASAADVQRIQLAKSTGILSLNLRGTSDKESQGQSIITAEDLLNKGIEPQRIDTTGWVKVNGAQFDVSASGQLIPKEGK